MVNEEEAMIGSDAAFWDEIFAGLEVVEAAAAEHWIEQVLVDVEARPALAGRVLELGCGLGWDTRWLVQAGGQVTALDGSAVALERLAAALPGPEYVYHRLPAPLPFPDASFDAVAAGLSLHYFPWDDTVSIIYEVHRVLRPGGLFVFAVNASGDAEFGYGRGVEIEPGLFAFDGRRKRFFTEADCRRLLATGWDLLALLPLEEQRYGRFKRMWVAAARRVTAPPQSSPPRSCSSAAVRPTDQAR
jgi:SAM-dependent methyltransferase